MEKTIDGSNVEGLVMDLAKIEGGWQGRWQKKLGAQRVNVLMFSFLWVYGYPLGLCFSFRYMSFLGVYVTLILFQDGIDVTLLFFWVWE
jgi:hypothetical protein